MKSRKIQTTGHFQVEWDVAGRNIPTEVTDKQQQIPQPSQKSIWSTEKPKFIFPPSAWG